MEMLLGYILAHTATMDQLHIRDLIGKTLQAG